MRVSLARWCCCSQKQWAVMESCVQEVAINDNFAKMTEALYVAEQSARQAVEMRSRVQRELAAKEKEKKDRELRELAIKARMDRLGGSAAANPSLAARAAGDVAPPPPSVPSRHVEVPHFLARTTTVSGLCWPPQGMLGR